MGSDESAGRPADRAATGPSHGPPTEEGVGSVVLLARATGQSVEECTRRLTLALAEGMPT